ncbi:MAG: hypothetical protein HYT85_18760 [candidate division NC10 bacterium]|nr:hypothetical protein [candidate division NC10 bacterium]MBI2562676.1 hypothetical protein [candidate division NC10 bacterium]
MKTRNESRRRPAGADLFQAVIRLVVAAFFPPWPVPVPVAAPRRSVRLQAPSRRWSGRAALTLFLLILASIPAWAGQPLLPSGVPNVFDPEVRARFQPVGVANLRGNPDFPVLILQNTVGGQPQVILLGLDARNGKDNWSLASDPIILIVLFADPETILGAHVDAGFAERGKPSGQYMTLADPTSPGLSDLLRSISLAATRTYM